MTSINDVLGGRYRLVRLLGRGGMSDVYQAVDQQSDTAVALKLVRSGDPEFARRLAQEARALEGFEHPGLIRLLDTGLAGDQAYLVMQLIDGPTLAQSLRGGPLDSRGAAILGARLADALAYVHGQGFVHRDVKPSNILLTNDGEAWLGDFGIARHHDSSALTVTGTTLGTVSYMAPEQLENHSVGPSADIWSLGIVLLECLTGRRAYEGSPSEVVARRMAGPVPLPADLPVPWKLVLTGMLDRRPDQRLNGAQVAAMLSTEVFYAPWTATDTEATQLLSSVVLPYDLTALTPGVVAATDATPRPMPVAAYDQDATVAVAAVGVGAGAATTYDQTATMGAVGVGAGAAASFASDTTLISKPASPKMPPATYNRRRWIAAAGIVPLAALGIGLAFMLGSNSANPHSTVTTRPPASTTAPTTTTMPASTTALGKLTSDIINAQSAGSILTDAAQAISSQAQQALTDQAAGNSVQATNDLQQAANRIVSGVQNGSIAQAEGVTLQSDLSVLATAMHLSVPTTVPTTVTGPGGDKGKGHGNGH